MRQARNVVVAVLITVMLAACSGSSASSSTTSNTSTVPAAQWAKEVCTSLGDWQTAVAARQSAFTPNTTDLTSLKQGWLDFLDGVLADTDTMLHTIQGAGAPDGDGGAAASAAFVNAMTTLRATFQSLRDKSAELPTTDPTAFSTQLKAQIADMQTSLKDLGSSLQALSGSSLDAVFTAEPACASLQG